MERGKSPLMRGGWTGTVISTGKMALVPPLVLLPCVEQAKKQNEKRCSRVKGISVCVLVCVHKVMCFAAVLCEA